MESPICPSCGKHLIPGPKFVGCPACLLAAGFESGSDESFVDMTASGERPDDADAHGLHPSTAPPPDALGKYVDLGLIGAGGMGEVRRVFDPELSRVVAMKIIRPELLRHKNVLARFVEETQATAQLQHPGIVPLYERGQLPDGRLYFTMKEVNGRTLGDVILSLHAASTADAWLPDSQGWTFRRVIDAFHKVCETLAYAHARGVVHRDLKPSNVMVGSFGEVLVMDWGLARVRGALSHDSSAEYSPVITDRAQDPAFATQVGHIHGTPAYMAPELARGEVDRLGPQRTFMPSG